MKRDFVLVIPARLKSTRLPRKLLIEIDGKTIIQRSYECAYKSIQDRDKIIVATDSYEIKNICDRFGAKTILTSESCMTGTDRVAEVSEKIDADQYIIICDRSKDMIKSGGEWISSVDLENHIVAMPEIAQAAVVAQPHPKWDERPVAMVIMAAGETLDQAAVIEHCSQIFAKWQLPDEVIAVESLPLGPTGKIEKKTIRANLEKEGYQLPDLR